MSKFAKMIASSNDSIKEQRAEMLAEEAVLEVDQLVNGLKKERNKLRNEITKLTDLAPDNSYSLRPGGKDFDAAQWVSKLHQAKLDLKLKEIELTEAESIKTEWFGEEA
jgi:hypothetical protein